MVEIVKAMVAVTALAMMLVVPLAAFGQVAVTENQTAVIEDAVEEEVGAAIQEQIVAAQPDPGVIEGTVLAAVILGTGFMVVMPYGLKVRAAKQEGRKAAKKTADTPGEKASQAISGESTVRIPFDREFMWSAAIAFSISLIGALATWTDTLGVALAGVSAGHSLLTVFIGTFTSAAGVTSITNLVLKRS